MDQLKTFLAFVKKNHFWILSGLAVLIGLVVYLAASSKLTDGYQKQKQQIASTDNQVSPLLNGTEHPNINWVQQVKNDSDALRLNVKNAWDALYTDQRNRVFVWPQELGPTVIATLSQSNPQNPNDPAVIEACERFQKYVKAEVRHMGAIVDADWPEDAKADPRGRPAGHVPGHGPDAAAAATEKSYLVVWDDADRQYWTDAYDWQDRPSTLDVRYAQEELWVMNAICQAIFRTNTGAKLNDEAIVRDINQLRIAYDAVGKFPLGEGEKRIVHLGKAPVGGLAVPTPGAGPNGAADQNLIPFEAKRPNRNKQSADDSDIGARAPPPGGGHGMGLNPAGAQTGVPEVTDPDAWLKDGRLVNPAGKPQLAKDLADPAVKEYRLMAFRLNLTVDELRWDRLLLELANSPLPLEVREVRINVTSENSGEAAGHGGQRRPQQPESDKGPVRNISLELRGVAYLINPPNPQSLGLADEAPSSAPPDNGATGAPATGTPTVPATGAPTAPGTGAPVSPATGTPTAPGAGTPVAPATSAPAAPATGAPAVPAPGPATPATGPAAPPSGPPATSAPATPPTGVPAPAK